jgi:hypothetical protein
LKQEHKLEVLAKKTLVKYSVAQKSIHGKHFDAIAALFQSICRTALQHCELCTEHGGFHVEQLL